MDLHFFSPKEILQFKMMDHCVISMFWYRMSIFDFCVSTLRRAQKVNQVTVSLCTHGKFCEHLLALLGDRKTIPEAKI